jgi:serine protease Do
VLPGSPAQKAGLQIGDVILRYDDHRPTDERALLRAIASTPVGETMKLLVRRDGVERTIPVMAAEWPRDQWDQRDAPMAVTKPKVVIPPDLGLTLAPIPAEHRSSMGLEQGLGGVLVSAVAPNSDPSRRGMVNGDIILRVQDKPVAMPAEVQAGITAARAEKRDYVLMLVLPKVRDVPGPKWIALALGTSES